MSIRSQAELEGQYQKRQAQVQSGELSAERAFGTMEDWVVQLGQRKALLHPGLKQWMWFDRLHNEWVTAGCGLGQGILLSIGNVGGIKKLLQPGDIGGWCVYRQADELFGPVRTDELLTRLKSEPELKDFLVWSPRATCWLSVACETGGATSFYDETGKQVLITVECDPEPAAGPSPTDVTLVNSHRATFDAFTLSIELEGRHVCMGSQVRLGSALDNDICIPGGRVSPQHALIQRHGVVYKITDLNSESGTHVNGKRITGATLLQSGDSVLIGDTLLKISDQP